MTEKKIATTTPVPAPTLTVEQVRELLREGQDCRREVEARLDRMERVDPKDASARAR